MARIDDDIDNEAVDAAIAHETAHTDDFTLADGADCSEAAEPRPLALIARRGGPADGSEQAEVLRHRRKTLDKLHASGDYRL